MVYRTVAAMTPDLDWFVTAHGEETSPPRAEPHSRRSRPWRGSAPGPRSRRSARSTTGFSRRGYVGAAEVEGDGLTFETKMAALPGELATEPGSSDLAPWSPRCLGAGLGLLFRTVRSLSPYISVLMLALQLISGGLLGPRMVCTDSDGTQSIELAVLTCCSIAPATAEQDAHDGCCSTECGGDRQEPKGTELGQNGCGCVDVPAADDPVVRQNDSRQATDLVAVHLSIAVLAVVAWPEPIAAGRRVAFLPPCHAPARAHIANIVLRI